MLHKRYNSFSISYEVDCEWDKWKTGKCSTTCGGGVKYVTRKKIVEAAHGGKNCSGDSIITESCNVEECPGRNMIRSMNNTTVRVKFEEMTYCLYYKSIVNGTIG